LNIPAKHSESGRRERHFFRTRDQALAAAAKLKGQRDTFGASAIAIAPSLAEAATAAAKLLEPYGVGLLEVVRQYVEREARLLASVPIEKALKAFHAAHPNWSDSHSRMHRLRGGKLTEAFAGRQLASITGEELREHIAATTNGGPSHNLAVRLAASFFRWASKQPRGWCDDEAVKHLEKVKENAGEIGVLTAAEAARLMAAAEAHHADCVAPFAIALFTGMRQAELERLRPSDITAEGITVPAVSSKTKRRRFVAMPEPLADWLAAYPIGKHVCPPNWQRKEKAVRRLAGWAVWTDLVEPSEPPADLPPWPSNALRHTAATAAVGLGKPIEVLVFEHGHSGGVALLKRHYLGVLPKAEAAAIWALRPHGKSAPKIRIA
jgi:integrase